MVASCKSLRGETGTAQRKVDTFAEHGLGDERALVITDEAVQAAAKQKLKFNVIGRARERKHQSRRHDLSADRHGAAGRKTSRASRVPPLLS
jgi:hypothetical protein